MRYRSVDFFETRLAATIRDYMRARDAGDQIAVEFGAQDICHGLGCLLGAYLKGAENWPSHERWIDGMVGAQVEIVAPDRLHVAGYMVWGLLSNVGGEQWAEPFQADVTIGWHTYDFKQYQMCFGDSRELAEKRVTPGSYQVLATSDDPLAGSKLQGPVGFEPLFDKSDDRSGFPYGPKHTLPWAYQFRKG